MKDITNFNEFHWNMSGLMWLITTGVLAPEIFKNYDREEVFKEISFVSLLILLFFTANTFLSTILKYYPDNQYHFSSGISFGHVGISLYGIFPLVIYLVFRRGLLEKNLFYLLVSVTALFLVFLTLRRSAMLLSVLACLCVMVELLNFKQFKQFALYILFFGIISSVVFFSTGFSDQLMERYEKRNLNERDLEEELRYLEFGLVYNDLFVFYDYDPWFGFGIFSSHGNYGKKAFGNRPLHSDINYFIHGLGFVGLFLYVITMSLIFYHAWQKCQSKGDKIMFCFILFYFLFSFLIGWSKRPLTPVMLFMILSLPYARQKVRFQSNPKKLMESNLNFISK
jgi:O-antigen ligase